MPLRSNARSDEEEAYFALSRWERFLGFCACVVGGGVCFLVAFLTLPFRELSDWTVVSSRLFASSAAGERTVFPILME